MKRFVLCVLAIALGMIWAPAVHAQIVAGQVVLTQGGLLAPWSNQGGYFSYIPASSQTAIYSVGSGTNGSFAWYETQTGATPTASMTLIGDTLTVTNLDGTAAKATNLAATPTQCNAPGEMTGINPNGNANCSSSTMSDEWFTFSSTCGSGITAYNGDATCIGTGTLPTAMPDTSYFVQCQDATGTHPSGTSWGEVTFAVEPTSTTGFSYSQGEVWGNGATSSAPMDSPITVSCHAHHN